MKTFVKIIALLVVCVSSVCAQKKSTAPDAKLEADKKAIKSMCGIYKVNFDFAETFSPDTGYKYHPRYREWGIEYVFIAEESPQKIVLQHLLIVNDTMIVKHWRQDWVYENTEVYKYYKDKNWIKNTLGPEQAKGTWTQKVYQVDDSPRYESYGTWMHVDGRHFWEATTDAPLPRREFTKRSDYNVMRRHIRVEVTADGWVYDQDNEKILRANGQDQLLCWEKGVEKFTKGNYDATPAIKFWQKQQTYWADVRKAWAVIYAGTPDLKLQSKVDGKLLFESLFALGDKHCNDKAYVAKAALPEIEKTLQSYLLKN